LQRDDVLAIELYMYKIDEARGIAKVPPYIFDP
jgi:hypothetical protein